METNPHVPTIYIVSGGAGTSGEQLVYTVLAQFPEGRVNVVTVGHVRQEEQITRVVAQAKESGGLILHTLVDVNLRRVLAAEAQRQGVPAIDGIGPLIDCISQALGQKPLEQPGRYRLLHREYFERVAAIDYTLVHDDGKNPDGWWEAEIVLVGVSRVGKTPLSLYLAVLGWKVANIPLVPQLGVPDGLFKLDPKRVIGLTIHPDQLLVYRRQRQSHLGVIGGDSAYFDLDAIQEELKAARKVFREAGFAVIDMTDKTIEMAADEIIRRIPFHDQ